MTVIAAKKTAVKTATVEVKVLSLSGKQMTLAVFRQLPESTLLDDETGELLGKPWGRVNYFFGDCRENHLHVVWQRGEELRRSCVYPKRADRTNTGMLREHVWKSYRVHTLLYATALTFAGRDDLICFGDDKDGRPILGIGETAPIIHSPSDQALANLWTYVHGGDDWGHWGRFDYKYDPNRVTRPLVGGLSLPEIADHWQRVLDQYRAVRMKDESITERRRMAYEALEKLDQLFIAI